MDSKNFQFSESDMLFPNRKQFRQSRLPQKQLSFPSKLMKYIWSNPSSPKLYQKLIKCCKLFFLKNPILILKNLEYDSIAGPGWNYCSADECPGRQECDYEHEKIDRIMMLHSRIWITQKLYIASSTNQNKTSEFIRQIYRCDVSTLGFVQQKLSFKDLRFLSKHVKEFSLDVTSIKDENSKSVALENIIQLFSGAKKVLLDFIHMSDYPICKSYTDFVDACSTIEEVELFTKTRAFNVTKFYEHLKKTRNQTLFKIYMSYNNADIEKVINEILSTVSFEFVPPVIDHDSLDEIKLQKMEEIQEREVEKYQ